MKAYRCVEPGMKHTGVIDLRGGTTNSSSLTHKKFCEQCFVHNGGCTYYGMENKIAKPVSHCDM